MIAEAMSNAPHPDKYRTGQTAQAWFMRRVGNMRVRNRTVSARPGRLSQDSQFMNRDLRHGMRVGVQSITRAPCVSNPLLRTNEDATRSNDGPFYSSHRPLSHCFILHK